MQQVSFMIDEAKLSLALSVSSAIVTAWGFMKYLMWPRIQVNIRQEVESVIKPYRDSMAQEMSEVVKELRNLTEAIQHVTVSQAGTKTAVDILLADRRIESPNGRRSTDHG